MGRRIGGLCSLLGRGSLVHILTQSRLGRGLPPNQVPSWSIQTFGHNKHGPNKGGGSAPFLGRGPGSPCSIMWPGTRPTSMPSAILIHPAVWPQRTWAENWGLCPFGGGGAGSHLTQCGQGRGLPACQVSSWSVQPFGHNTPTLQTDRTDRQVWQHRVNRSTNGRPNAQSKQI